MKSGGPWNLRGLRPEARAAAREAARRSGMSVGEWLNTVIRPAEEREAEPQQSGRSDRTEGRYEHRGFYPDDRETGYRRDREPPQRQVEAEIDYDERGYDYDQERERHAGRRAPDRGEPRRRPVREQSRERGFGDDDLNREHERQISPRRPAEAPREHWTRSSNDEVARDWEPRYDPLKSPRERARNHPRRENIPEDQHDRNRNRARAASSPERDEQWFEHSGAAERYLPRESYREPPRRAPDDEPEDSWRHGDDHQRDWPEAVPQTARDEEWREKSRSLRNREPDEDRFEDLNADEGERFRERYRNPPRLAPERETEDSSWQEETDRYFLEPSPDADGESEDAERSNFDHDPHRAARRRPLLEPEEPFETLPREGRYISERGPASRRDAPEPEYWREGEPSDEDALGAQRAKAEHRPRSRQSADQWKERFSGERDESMPLRARDPRPRADDAENLPPQRMRPVNREEHRRRRDTRRQRQGPSDDEHWRPEQDTRRDDSAPPADSHRGESTGLGGPYRDLSAAAPNSPPPAREQRRDVIVTAADPEDVRDAAVDKAIAEITVRQRALDEAAAAEMAARLHRAEILAAQRGGQNKISARERPVSPQHSADLDIAAEAFRPPASTETAAQQMLRSHPPADMNAGAGAPDSRDAEVASGPKAEPRPLDPPPAAVNAPAPLRADAAAAPAPQQVPNDALVAEITARMRALDRETAAYRKAAQWLEERQTGAATAAPQRPLVDDVAADILAEKNERNSGAGEGAFSLQPVSLDLLSENGRPAADDGRKNAPPPQGVDLGSLERQLRQLTTRIETLRPTSDFKAALEALRRELSEIGQAFTKALPQDALESLEFEIRALGHRLDDSRRSGADLAALAGIERGLEEVREGLRGLTPAEGLIGFGEAIAELTEKVDAIVAKNDPAALEQLETAIGNLRHAVSRVASDDALSKVAEDVRSLSAKIDGFADLAKNNPAALEQLHIAISNLRHAVSRVASDDALSMVAEDVRLLGARIDDLAHSVTNNPILAQIESRIDALTTAIHASTKAGQGTPRELEKLLTALVDKLELSQLTQTDHTALAHLEDRIAMLMQRLDASDARLGLLEGVERGLADLLVYIEQLRGGNGGTDSASGKLISATVEHQFAEIRDSERRTQDSLDAVQGTVEHVVDRLARIESDMHVHRTWNEPADLSGTQAPELAPALSPAEEPETSALDAPEEAAKAAEIEPTADRRSGTRAPIDPNLPPDHPIEPGSAPGRTRRPVSPAERIAAFESSAAAKAPVIPDPPGGKADFIAAARRAAQAAASTSPADKSSAAPGTATSTGSKKLTERLRTLFVAAAVVAIVVGGFRVVSQMFERGSPPPPAQTTSPRVLTEPPQGSPLPLTPSEPMKQPATPGGASGTNTTNMPKTVTVPGSGAEAEQNPAAAPAPAPAAGAGAAGQSLLNTPNGFAVNSGTLPDVSESATKNASTAWSGPDVTGSLPPAPRNSAAPLVGDKLPLAIGGPTLRTAAAAGDPAAAYEVGVRFAEGRSVPQNNEEGARWLEIAAKKGFVPAQFRLGTLYEKGIGVKKDLPEALQLYRAAADKGHGKAMHNLAVLYAEGATGAPDYRTAAQWFRKAADMGVTDSQYNLAILYARGVGVEQSFAESYKWFFLAAKQGDKDAMQKRDDVAARLDQQALAAAKSAAEQWAPQPQPAEAVTVKASEAWDAPAKGASGLKTKSHSAAKVPASDVMRVD